MDTSHAMSLTPDDKKELEQFPAVLRALLDDELAAGNEIHELSHGFPAPPRGAYIRLRKRVTTRPAASGNGLSYRDFNSSIYSGEYTDAERVYFVIEPPGPPPEPPDMDEIRRRANQSSAPAVAAPSRIEASTPKVDKSLVDTFRDSMVMDYEKWHDGVGYDLDLLERATSEERNQIETILLQRGVSDWRDVEALAALKTERSDAALRRALKSSSSEIRTAVLSHAPRLLTDAEKTETLVRTLKNATVFGGLAQALMEVETFHPPAVIETLFEQTLTASGDVAVHYAAMLFFLHGKAKEPFDWDHRPFFLRFNTNDRKERRAVYDELCAKLKSE